jgi:hypothetical protein
MLKSPRSLGDRNHPTRKHSEANALFSQMILYRDASRPSQLGILKFRSLAPGTKKHYEDWEKKALLNSPSATARIERLPKTPFLNVGSPRIEPTPCM